MTKISFSSFTWEAVTRRRPLDTNNGSNSNSHSNNDSNNDNLQRRLTATDLIFYGVGCSVGAGIYSLVGIGARTAGPAIAVSFFLAGVSCCFTSLAYSEFAARIPTAGSAYTFVYVAFGELSGWLVGWNLTLGYAVSAAVVARSWAEYLVAFLATTCSTHGDFQFQWLTKYKLPLLQHVLQVLNVLVPQSEAESSDYVYTCCPLSMVIILFCTLVLVMGVKESARFNTIMTLLNLSVLCFTLLAGLPVIDTDNLVPVFPHGIRGMAQGAGLVFFAYLGFDMVSCLSEEVIHPERNMPIGIIGSLTLSMAIYVAIALVVVGMAPISLLGNDTPIVNALLANACCSHADQILSLDDNNYNNECLSYSCHHQPSIFTTTITSTVLYVGSRMVSFGAIFGLTTATFTCLMGQPRIFYSMAKDGLLFSFYARVNPKTGVPTIGTLLTGFFTAIVACFMDLESLANTISLGTLMVFTFVNAGVIVLRLQFATTTTSESFLSSPLLRHPPLPPEVSSDPGAAAVARTLGLFDQTSEQIRSSLRSSCNNSSSLRSTAADVALFTTSNTSMSDNHNNDGTKKPIIIWLLAIFTMSTLVASAAMSRDEYWALWIAILAVLMLVLSTAALVSMPQYYPPPEATFACPMVPTVPLLGILCNSYMMGSMPSQTWKLIGIWLFVGLLFYFGYGIHHSELRRVAAATATAAHRHQDDGHYDDEYHAGDNHNSTTALLLNDHRKDRHDYQST